MRNGKCAGKNHLFVNFNENGVISRFFKFQSVDVIDQIDPMLWAWWVKVPFYYSPGLFIGHRNSDGNFQMVLSLRQIGKGKKPDHSWMYNREFLGSQIWKNSQQCVLPGCWVNIYGIAGYPGEDLGFGGHLKGRVENLIQSATNQKRLNLWIPSHKVTV